MMTSYKFTQIPVISLLGWILMGMIWHTGQAQSVNPTRSLPLATQTDMNDPGLGQMGFSCAGLSFRDTGFSLARGLRLTASPAGGATYSQRWVTQAATWKPSSSVDLPQASALQIAPPVPAPRPARTMSWITVQEQVLPISRDFRDYLQHTSGLDLVDGQISLWGNAGYSLGVGSRVDFQYNELPLVSPDGGTPLYELVSVDLLSAINVGKGAWSASRGSGGLGGMVSASSMVPYDRPRSRIRWQGGLFGTPSEKVLDWDGRKTAKNTGLSLFHLRQIGRFDLGVLGDVWRDMGWRQGTRSSQGRFMVNTAYRPQNHHGFRWGLNGAMSYDSSATFLFWDGYQPVPGAGGAYIVPMATGDTLFQSPGAYAGTATARRQFNTRFMLDPSVHYTTEEGTEHALSGRLLRTINRNDAGQSTQSTMVYERYRLETKLLDGKARLNGTASANYFSARGDSIYGGRHQGLNTSLMGEIPFYLLKNDLFTNVTARLDHWTMDGIRQNLMPSGRIGMRYEIVSNTVVRAVIGNGFRNPTIAELFTRTRQGAIQVVPNPDLAPERGYTGELGFMQVLGRSKSDFSLRETLEFTGFVMDHKNLIELAVHVPEPLVGTPMLHRYENVSHARIKGIECQSTTDFRKGKVYATFYGGVTYMDPVNRNAVAPAQQVDLLHTMGTQAQPWTPEAAAMLSNTYSPENAPGHLTDNPAGLKYRSKLLVRANLLAGYRYLQCRVYYRYKSAPLAMDQLMFYYVPGTADFVRTHPNGYGLVDAYVTAQLEEGYFVSFGVENLFNTAYMVRPGLIGEQRNFNIQVKYDIFGRDRY